MKGIDGFSIFMWFFMLGSLLIVVICVGTGINFYYQGHYTEHGDICYNAVDSYVEAKEMDCKTLEYCLDNKWLGNIKEVHLSKCVGD